ncbi:rho GTPase-activating protein 44 [Platysternon megacephalum]|uniref:Rho GTPase-activating protein 44 n=1 Tax=Platysternon megacephalum TaxID=55544 RepID=A0A4D9EGE1_9SAUR|nr:rho GTPase-activating protein 44 [Platysternon megacephalum]
MASCWAVLLLLVTVAAAVPVKTPEKTPEPYEKAIAQAIAFYNQGPTVKYAFRLLTATPPPEVAQGTISNTVQLNFTIMETTCSVSDQTPVEQCDFKENGLVRDCSGHFSTQEACPVLAITCDVAPPQAATNEVLQLLEFTVKETECPVSENLLLHQCNIRGNGAVRKCSGTVSTEPQAPLVLLTCDTVAQEAKPLGDAISQTPTELEYYTTQVGQHSQILHSNKRGYRA